MKLPYPNFQIGIKISGDCVRKMKNSIYLLMKNIFFALVILFFAFISCRDDDKVTQNIDQVVHLYIDSAGQDMLNNNIPGSYTNIQWNDVYGFLDNAPVSFSNRKDIDTVNFLEYVAGARRILIDSSDSNTKIYESKIDFLLTKRLTDSTTTTFTETLTLNYLMKPEVFRLEKAWYKGNLVFSKVEGEPNIIKIKK